MINRERKVNIEQLSTERIQELSEQIGEKLRNMIDKTCEDANKLLNIYGLQMKMQYLIEPISKEDINKGELE